MFKKKLEEERIFLFSFKQMEFLKQYLIKNLYRTKWEKYKFKKIKRKKIVFEKKIWNLFEFFPLWILFLEKAKYFKTKVFYYFKSFIWNFNFAFLKFDKAKDLLEHYFWLINLRKFVFKGCNKFVYVVFGS